MVKAPLADLTKTALWRFEILVSKNKVRFAFIHTVLQTDARLRAGHQSIQRLSRDSKRVVAINAALMILMGLAQGFELWGYRWRRSQGGGGLASRFQRAESDGSVLGELQAGGGVDWIRAHRFFKTYRMREVDDNLQHLERVRSSSTQYSDGGIANRRIEVVIPHVNPGATA
jgi:hypothetical protein